MSNGGCLGHIFASKCGLQLGGLATVCAAMPGDKEQGAQVEGFLTSPKIVFVANSLGDEIMPYQGGQTQSDVQHAVLSHKDTVEYWKTRLEAKEFSLASEPIYKDLNRINSIDCKCYESETLNKIISITSSSARHSWDLLISSKRIDKCDSQRHPRRNFILQKTKANQNPSETAKIITKFMLTK